jgi:hypothetical protein
MKSNLPLWIIIVLLLLVIGVMFTNNGSKNATTAVSSSSHATTSIRSTASGQVSTNTSSSTVPLSARVTVLFPKSGAVVGRTFAIAGSAPGGWYFESSFPIQVRDRDDNVIGRGIGKAQTDWMVDTLVAFKSSITLTNTYVGPANLILLRDNPSGLPENADLVTIPIIVK